jgi:hypothetical protein
MSSLVSSWAEQEEFKFAYRVRVTNTSTATVQLVGREWCATTHPVLLYSNRIRAKGSACTSQISFGATAFSALWREPVS